MKEKQKSLQERWDEEVLTDNAQFEVCKQCLGCIYQSDGTVWSNHYQKGCCQKYPYPNFKPTRVIDNKEVCPYRNA